MALTAPQPSYKEVLADFDAGNYVIDSSSEATIIYQGEFVNCFAEDKTAYRTKIGDFVFHRVFSNDFVRHVGADEARAIALAKCRSFLASAAEAE